MMDLIDVYFYCFPVSFYFSSYSHYLLFFFFLYFSLIIAIGHSYMNSTSYKTLFYCIIYYNEYFTRHDICGYGSVYFNLKIKESKF